MSIIITFCVLLLVAYLFDLTSSKTKIPSVLLLLLLGAIVHRITDFLEIDLPDFTNVLPIFGTIGLILIVLEGSLELEINKSKIGLIKKSSLGALIPLLITAFIISFLFQYYGGYSFKASLINAIPFCIISSAIAIPSVRNLSERKREFVTYESSLSDIFGVIFFNFILYNSDFQMLTFGHFIMQIVIMILISFLSTLLLSFLLNKIDHHIKFVPIILLVILIYEISKMFHLPALFFILIFGLSINNFDELKGYKWAERFRTDSLTKEVEKFKELNTEVAFVVRSLFFLLFGYLIETSEILNPDTLVWAVAIVVLIYIIRALQLYFSKLPLLPLLFVAPRGLITILLFLTITSEFNIDLVNKSLIIQVILISSLMMMLGLIAHSKKEKPPLES
ncbi:sodium:proton antiporter [Flavobacterium sp. GA093]|uniref:Sodium:proton antiporter n=1 Tax=Flavobacterium hydrocarbonoxydans TaxID=2683249 RepID=A0A6I4NK64_9FLAO|nr:cation:proton antiporter [Flavobacterium hydrocarbonoxydans]MWB94886.1 sodium:proton antiporter [Flavobacterium hydrocarbonoxydans]